MAADTVITDEGEGFGRKWSSGDNSVLIPHDVGIDRLKSASLVFWSVV